MGTGVKASVIKLLEVTVQQAFQSLAVASLVTSLLWDILCGIRNYGIDRLPYSNLLLS